NKIHWSDWPLDLNQQSIVISVGPWTGPVQWTTTGLDQSSPVPVLTGTGPK
ncbi:32498_t:CDS:2, partial [Racocetra persica]